MVALPMAFWVCFAEGLLSWHILGRRCRVFSELRARRSGAL